MRAPKRRARDFWAGQVRLTLVLLALTLVLASCSLTNSPAPTVAPPTAGVPSAPTQPVVSGTAIAVPTFVPGGNDGGTPGAVTLPPNLPVPTGDQAKVDSKLFDIAIIYQQQGRGAAEQAARDYGLLNTANEVLLTLVLADQNTAPVEAKITELGGRVVASYENVIEMAMALDAVAVAAQNNPVAQLAAFSSVEQIKITRRPGMQSRYVPGMTSDILRAQMAPIVSEGVKVIGADQWQSAGITGKGVKVGIIDLGFAGYQQLLGQELPTNVQARSFNSTKDITGGGEVHGTACAEIVHAVAPDAELYIANIDSDASVGQATDWMISQGVKIISASFGSVGTTRGDGTGLGVRIVDNARAKGVLFVVAAGNSGDEHYAANLTDGDGNGWHEFAPGKEFLKISVGSALDVRMRWDAWTGEPVNLDLYLFSADGRQYLDSSRNVQSRGVVPVETLIFPLDRQFQRQTYQLRVRTVGNVRPVKLEIFVANSETQLLTPVGSVATPADAKGAFTVGATDVRDLSLEDFSSQGPTADNRVKPEITAPDRVLTASYQRESPSDPAFPGTSAATPHVAGAAALVLSSLGTATPDQIQQFLVGRAQDIEDPGVDPKSGAGDIRLGAPTQQGAAAPSASPRASASPSPRASASPSARPSARPSTVPSAAPTANGPKLAVAPGSGPVGTKFTITGGGFPANSQLPVVIVDSAGKTFANATINVRADGAINATYDSTGDPNGQYTVAVGDSAGNVLATATYTVGAGGSAPSARPSAAPSARPSVAPTVAPSTRPSVAPSAVPSAAPSAAPRSGGGDPVVGVSPNNAPAGTRFGITGAGFTPSTPVLIGVFDAANKAVASGRPTTTGAGTLQLTLDSASYPAGEYIVGIFTADGETLLAAAVFAVR
ncbi:MAG: hypothetical protein AVDCRST_MAG18-1261 [uncultured Thermomicrobiales bacterium]|uniref:Peptidase S8/S53 domain-containing protein n=1 Tax=uncultured Thermomicrobiales bacterium TaxID=1645740 RepID=A0A6J4V076_9BACT|nr:MAG: hypothetical protein AVDCRST_MAG18-1261 [uncultured Thermomicrobiales bacterium]